MSLYKQRGSKIWWYEFQFCGVRYRESSKSTSKTVALEAERARRRQVEESFNGIKKRESPKTFSAALDELIAVKEATVAPGTLEIMQRCDSHVRPVFGKKLLSEIIAAEIMEFMEKRLSPTVSESYANFDFKLIRAVLRRFGFWERIRPDVSMYRVDDEFGCELPESDEPRLLEECARSTSRGLFPAVKLALSTGMRGGEIRHLRWSQVFLDGDAYLIVGVSKTKTGRRRRVPLNASAVEVLMEWARQFPDRLADDYVFPAVRYGYRSGGGRVTIYKFDPTKPTGSWRFAWRAARQRAGIQIRFHDLRHTAVTRMLRAGIPLTTVAAIVGWSPANMYLMAKRYAHILQPEMRTAVGVLDTKVPESVAAAAKIIQVVQTIPFQPMSRYNREELYEEVWEAPMQTVAKKYGVSGGSVGKACRKLNIPVPSPGYWAKKAVNLPVPPRPPLPALGVLSEHETNGTVNEPNDATL
jgi:integrase